MKQANLRTTYWDLRFVWVAGAIHWTVRWFEALATSIFVFELTGSPLDVALIFVARYSSLALFGSLTGVLAERFNRRTMLLSGYGLLSLVFAILAILVFLNQLQLWHIFLGAFINGIGMALEFPVRRTMMGDLAGFQKIGFAMTVDQTTRKITDMIGPLIGGLVFQLVGIQGIFLMASSLLLLATSLILAISFNFASIKPQKKALLPELLQAFVYTRSHPVILAVLVVTMIGNIFGFHALMSMVPVIGIEALHLNPFLIGLLLATAGLGGVLASIWLSMFALPLHYRRLFLYGTLMFFLTSLLFAFSSFFWLSFSLLFIGGIGMGLFGGMQSTILMREATPEMRSRVMGLLAVSIGATPFGMLTIGALAEWLSATQALGISELVGTLLILFCFFFWPEFRKN